MISCLILLAVSKRLSYIFFSLKRGYFSSILLRFDNKNITGEGTYTALWING